MRPEEEDEKSTRILAHTYLKLLLAQNQRKQLPTIADKPVTTIQAAAAKDIQKHQRRDDHAEQPKRGPLQIAYEHKFGALPPRLVEMHRLTAAPALANIAQQSAICPRPEEITHMLGDMNADAEESDDQIHDFSLDMEEGRFTLCFIYTCCNCSCMISLQV